MSLRQSPVGSPGATENAHRNPTLLHSSRGWDLSPYRTWKVEKWRLWLRLMLRMAQPAFCVWALPHFHGLLFLCVQMYLAVAAVYTLEAALQLIWPCHIVVDHERIVVSSPRHLSRGVCWDGIQSLERDRVLVVAGRPFWLGHHVILHLRDVACVERLDLGGYSRRARAEIVATIVERCDFRSRSDAGTAFSRLAASEPGVSELSGKPWSDRELVSGDLVFQHRVGALSFEQRLTESIPAGQSAVHAVAVPPNALSVEEVTPGS